LREAGNPARRKESERKREREGRRERRGRDDTEKVRGRSTEGRNKARRKAIPTAIVRKPCKDCGPISAPSCVREFISSLLLPFRSASTFPDLPIFTVASVQRRFVSEREGITADAQKGTPLDLFSHFRASPLS